MKEENLALHSNKTWSLVPRPAHAKVIGSKRIFKTRLKNDGTLARKAKPKFKALITMKLLVSLLELPSSVLFMQLE